MIRNYLLLCLFGILVCFLTGTVSIITSSGFEVYDDLYAYQVSVQIRGRGHVCGGGIIADRFILTAAHCVLNRTRHLRSSHIRILAGTNSLHVTGPPAMIIRVDNVFFPKEFHPQVEFNVGDISVLRLVSSLQLGYHPHLRMLEFSRNYEHHSEGTIVGFGWNEFHAGIGRTDGRLRLAMFDVLSNENCEKAFPQGAIHSDVHFCAKNLINSHLINQSGLCIGDGGGPLVKDLAIVTGILNRIPPGCNGWEYPAVFTRVAYYSRMIFNVIERGYDSEMISLHT